jgi:hypothetical protein
MTYTPERSDEQPSDIRNLPCSFIFWIITLRNLRRSIREAMAERLRSVQPTCPARQGAAKRTGLHPITDRIVRFMELARVVP